MNRSSAIEWRAYGPADAPALIYLPGLHGDWTLVASFRAALGDRVRFVELAYPVRTDWRLADYSAGVRRAAAACGIARGWLLAESFGSQVAWQLLAEAVEGLEVEGLILAGGFVRHPVIPGVHFLHALHTSMPGWLFADVLRVYAAYARLRHRHAPETRASIAEFVARRTPEDRAAIGSRYPLIAAADLRGTARGMHRPVYVLSGVFDPIVPWPLVHPWLKKQCPGFRERRLILRADHNVLGTAPRAAAEQVWQWLNAPG